MEKGAGGARASEGGEWTDSDIDGENRGRKMEMREVSWVCEVKGRESRQHTARRK